MATIDIGKMSLEINNLSEKFDLANADALEAVKNAQDKQKMVVFNEIAKDNKDLERFVTALQERQSAKRFAAIQLDSKLARLAGKLSKNKMVMEKIKASLPNLYKNLQKYHQFDKGRDID